MKTKITQEQIAQSLGVQKYILASWEKQLNMEPTIESGEQFYTEQQVEIFKKVKELLYEQGLTMAAAKSALENSHVPLEGKTLRAASPLFFEPENSSAQSSVTATPQSARSNNATEGVHAEAIATKLLSIKAQLIKISHSL